MKILKGLTIIFLVSLICSCGSNSGHKKSDFSINTNAKKSTITNSETLELSIENPKNHVVDSVKYLLNDLPILEGTNLTDAKLGKHSIKATVFFNIVSPKPKSFPVTTWETIERTDNLSLFQINQNGMYAYFCFW